MTQTIYLDPTMVPASLRGAYQGKKFKARVCETVTIPATAGLWDGGSRDTYTAIEFETGRTAQASDNMSAPWDRSRQDHTIELKPGFCIVEHSIFCGKDSGLTFYVHPANAAALLPAPAAELTDFEKIVLNATRSYKSSYAGRDRYQMAQEDNRYSTYQTARDFPTRNEWERCKSSLIAKGLLNKAGAITNAGRNALPSRY